jgi:hypothetical protein
MRLTFLCLFLLNCFIIIVNSTTTCKSCIKAFDLDNEIIGSVIESSTFVESSTIYGNAAYNTLIIGLGTFPINITGTITTPYNTQTINDIINTELPCDCNVTYTVSGVSTVTIYPGRTCFTVTSFVTGTITFDGLGDPSSVFILTFAFGSVNLQYDSLLINDAQPCNINFITPNSFVIHDPNTYYGRFFASYITVLSTISIYYGGLYAANILQITSITVHNCTCQLPANQYDQCTPQSTHKQIIYNVKCSNSLSCSS